jgi:hypothetical protein
MDISEITELQDLKEKADELGITYSPNIGFAKLKEKVEAFLSKVKGKEAKHKEAKNHAREANKLVRCIVTCNNPTKSDWQGEIVSAGNALVSPIKKFIAFNVEYHVPAILLNVLRERRYQKHYTEKIKGINIRKTKILPEFTIQELPPLTTEEFDAIRSRQLARKEVGEE